MARRSAELCSFLRAHREAVTPQDAGLIPGGGRRVRGLRREEVALLAGLSTDYYRRLEQGREHRPSLQVLVAIARALQLDSHATAYLVSLVHPVPFAKSVRPNTMVSAGIEHLLHTALRTPALVVDLGLNILAINSFGRAMYTGFDSIDNLARMVFLDPAAEHFYVHWQQVATQIVANLRSGLTHFPGDRRITDVVEEISVRSPAFAGLWATNKVGPRTSEDKLFNHPELGELRLHFDALEIADAPDQRIFVYCAPDGGPSADAVTALVSRAELTG
ncbi:helix-turn-helix transcriptional regulator [Mycobacterium sp. 21AC1]|uniref:helix-turn-helix domain-containing protein n=1 Tax=[Mycobacterium] appelbergii TaxID=2939269 RepID=UPI0029393992|nr:helix-turn-helix transcriptional regulator [Mycobacterium sp. 21AC1]MDV3128412.1 helix-turn-helix transcriptional regulator [Mycobacterium sp. 21AC1]